MVAKYSNNAWWVSFFLIIGLYAILILPSFADAQGNLRLGPLRIHPGFQVSEEYSDNIYHAATNEKSDYITRLSPSLRLQLPIRKHVIGLGYKAVFIEAASEEEYSTTDQYADFLLGLMFPGGLEIKLTDNFKDTSTAPESPTDKRNNYMMNDTMFLLAFGFEERWRIQLDYTHTFRSFDNTEDELDNYVEDAGKGTLFFKIFPKTSFLLEYRYSHRDNEDLDQPTTSDNENHTVHAGLSWAPGAKLSGAIKAGYAKKVWETSTLEDEATTSIDTDVTWHATEKVSLGLMAFRRIVETLESLERGSSAGFGMTYITTGGNLSFHHRPNAKISWKAGISYSRDEYNQTGGSTAKDREDARFGGSLSFNYQIQEWLGLGLRYNYVANDSNFDAQEYTENRGMFYINLAL